MSKIKFCERDSIIYFNDDYSEDYDVLYLDKWGNREIVNLPHLSRRNNAAEKRECAPNYRGW